MNVVTFACMCLLFGSGHASFWKVVDKHQSNRLGGISSTKTVRNKLKCIVICSSTEDSVAVGISDQHIPQNLSCSCVTKTTGGSKPFDFNIVYIRTSIDLHKRQEIICSCSLPENNRLAQYLYITQLDNHNVSLFVYNPSYKTFKLLNRMTHFGGDVIAFVPDSSHCRFYWLEKINRTTNTIFSSCLNGKHYEEVTRGPIVAFAVERPAQRVFYTLKKNNKYITYAKAAGSDPEIIYDHGGSFYGKCFDVDSERKFFFWCYGKGGIYKLDGKQYDSSIPPTQDDISLSLTFRRVPRVHVVSATDLFGTNVDRELIQWKLPDNENYLNRCPDGSLLEAFGGMLGRYPYIVCYVQNKYRVYFFDERGNLNGNKAIFPLEGGTIVREG